MKSIVVFVLLLVAVSAAFLFLRKNDTIPQEKSSQPQLHKQEARQSSMKITSSAFEDNSTLPKKYTCEGEGVNPPLAFSDIPQGTKTLALIVEDPDAVSKKPWIHWVLFNISPNVSFVKEGSKPGNSQEGVNDGGENGYGPACPPKGTGVHHYIFRLYALSEKLDDMPEFTDKDMLLEAMHGHVLASAKLIGLYPES